MENPHCSCKPTRVRPQVACIHGASAAAVTLVKAGSDTALVGLDNKTAKAIAKVPRSTDYPPDKMAPIASDCDAMRSPGSEWPDGPNHLGLRYNALPSHRMALITSGCAPSRPRATPRCSSRCGSRHGLQLQSLLIIPTAAVTLLKQVRAAQKNTRRKAGEQPTAYSCNPCGQSLLQL